MNKSALIKLTDYLWEIPRSFRSDMRVPARVYASEALVQELFKDKSLEQLVNVATLPGIQKHALVMPDVHEGYGFPIGGVAAMDSETGVISPGGIGYDINCGVRLIISQQTSQDMKNYVERLGKSLYQQVPSGIGRGGQWKLNDRELEEVLANGLNWAMQKGYASQEDADHIESGGRLENADPALVSRHAKNRGRDQLGTMGAGNHFVEIGKVEQIFDEDRAKKLGLFKDQVTAMVHCGSRGLGHQIATDSIRVMLNKLSDYKINLPDRELACAPVHSPEGKDYFAAMAAAANFAWANRQFITSEIRQTWQEVFGSSAGNLKILYDVAHNIAKVEEHEIDGVKKKVIVHRKGATRAFPDQPVIIPGSMGTASYVLIGTPTAMRESFGSSCHGAGRRMSRHAALRAIDGRQLHKELQTAGIHIQTGSLKGLAEEAPQAYKDVAAVVDTVASAGLAKKVAILKPLIVIKG